MAPPAEVARFEASIDGAAASLGRVRVLPGGETRQESVALGVAALCSEATIVCVHDAARPLVDPITVVQVLEAASSSGAATAACRPSDSVREDRGADATAPVDRARLWLVETPQAFRRDLLVRAHADARRSGTAYTDDASLVEAGGHAIRIVSSLGRNLKITIETDLVLAAELLRRTTAKH
jgi:2-C-methyl-D-erythritol 4-phosphate cytidylyltransferase